MSNGESINFLLGCAPNWIDHPDTVLTAGGEVAGREVENLQTKLMGETWRTPNLLPHRTKVTVDFGATERASRALLIGNHNLLGADNFVRVRRDDEITEDRLWPAYNDGVNADAFIAPDNVTGTPSMLHEDPLGSITTWVTPTDPEFTGEMDFRVRLQKPRRPLKTGPFLQSILVAWRPEDELKVLGSLYVALYQNGVDQAIGINQDGDLGGEEGTRVLELKFDAADLDDPTGADLEVLISSVGAGLHEIGGVVWHATWDNREYRITSPPSGAQVISPTNTDPTTPNAGEVSGNPFDPPFNDALHIEANNKSADMSFRVGLVEADVVGKVAQGANLQVVAIRCERTQGTGSPIATVEVWQNGVDQGISGQVTISTNGDHFVIVPFDAADLDDTSGANFEVKVIGTTNGSDNIRVFEVMWFALTTETGHEFDSGYIEISPVNPNSLWGEVIPDDVGKVVIASLPVIYENAAGSAIALTGRFMLIEFYARSAYIETASPGVFEFTNLLASGDDFLDLGRLAEGPGLDGMNLARGFQFEVVDLSSSDTSDGGVLWEDQEDVYRVARIKLTSLRKEIALSDLFEYLYRRVGTTEDVLLVIYPEDEQFRRSAFVWGPMVRPGGLDNDEGVRFFSNLQIRERL